MQRRHRAGLPVLIAALTAVQRETPDALLGRAVATAHTLVYTPNVLGLAARPWSNWSTSGPVGLPGDLAGHGRCRCFSGRPVPHGSRPGPRPTPTPRGTAGFGAPSPRARGVRGEVRAAPHAETTVRLAASTAPRGLLGERRQQARAASRRRPHRPRRRGCARGRPRRWRRSGRTRGRRAAEPEAVGRGLADRRDRRLLEGTGRSSRHARVAFAGPAPRSFSTPGPAPSEAAAPRRTGSRAVPHGGGQRVGVEALAAVARRAVGQKHSDIRYIPGVPERHPRRSCRGRAGGRARTSRATPVPCRAPRAAPPPRRPEGGEYRARGRPRDAGRPGVAVAVGVDDAGVAGAPRRGGSCGRGRPRCAPGGPRPRGQRRASPMRVAGRPVARLVRSAARGPPSWRRRAVAGRRRARR